MLTNAGISKFFMCIEYPDDSYKSLFKEAKIEFTSIQIPELTITQKK
jgi:hypothetical protein